MNAWLCLHLDANGRPCNRVVANGSIEKRLCPAHGGPKTKPTNAAYLRKWKAERRNAGVMWEG